MIKTKLLLCTLSLGIFLMGCKDRNPGHTDDDQGESVEISDDLESAAQTTGQPTDAYAVDRNEQLEALYSRFNMSEEQIEQFEKNFPGINDSLNSDYYNNPDLEKSFRDVLTEAQYKEYEAWRESLEKAHSPNK